jgi:hypothetical protein
MRSRCGRGGLSILVVAWIGLMSAAAGQASPGGGGSAQDTFPPLEQWRDAVTSGNASVLGALYSSAPPARVNTPGGAANGQAEVAFWSALKISRMKVQVVQSSSPQAGLQQVVFQTEIRSATPHSRVLYVSVAQLWQRQNGSWQIVVAERSDPTRLQQPVSTGKDIYGSSIDARTEITQAVREAENEHKRVLLLFGANLCYDCHVLDLAFQRADISAVLRRDYKVVHVDVGQGDKNQDLMSQYDVPMKRGIPAAAILDGNGKLLVSQKNGEFEKARGLGPEDLLQFLNKWKPQSR